MRKFRSSAFLWLSLIVLFAGCSGGSGGGGAAPGGNTVSPDTTAPAAPTGVTATAGKGKATIAWTAVSGATSYNVYWSAAAGVTPVNGTKMAGVVSPYDKTGLDNGTTYYFVVTAVNANGESAASSQASATPVFVPPPASGPGTLGELPKSAPIPMGTTDNAAAVLAKQVLAGDAGSLPALLRAIDLAGFTIQHDGATVQAPSGVSQGIAFQAWEVQAIDKLMRDRLETSFGEVAALFASTTTETASIPFEILMYEGIRTNATGTNAALRFWAQFIIELGWQGPYAYDLMSDNTLTNVTVDAVQTAFIFKRLSADLAVFANNHSPTPLKARSLRTGVRAAGTASSPCTTEGIKQEIMDWNAAVISTGFAELMGYLEKIAGLAAGEKLGKIAGISNLALTYLKLVATKAMFTAKVEMDGGPPLKRTTKTTTDGERKTLTATVTMDDTNAQWVNCLRPAINAMGLDFDLPHAGAVRGAEINWRLVRPRPKVLAGGTVDHGIVQFVGGDPVHAAGNITNDLGQSTFDIEGVRQPKAISPTAKEVKKEAMVYADVILKPANMYQDIKDAVTNSGFSYFNFGSLDGVITMPAELLYRTRWMFGRGYEFEVIDWSVGFTGSIIVTEKGKTTEVKPTGPDAAGSGFWTMNASYNDRRTMNITGSPQMDPYYPGDKYASALLDVSTTTDNKQIYRCDGYARPMCGDPWDGGTRLVDQNFSVHNELSISPAETFQQDRSVRVKIFPDGHYEISFYLDAEPQVGSYSATTNPFLDGRTCTLQTITESGVSNDENRGSTGWMTVKGFLDPDNPNRLKGSQELTDYEFWVHNTPPKILFSGCLVSKYQYETTMTVEWDLAI